MNLKTLKVLIAGATGFIGRNIAEKLVLNQEYSVTGIWHNRKPYDLEGMSWINADLTLKDDINRVLPGFDIVIQMASFTTGSKDVINSPYIHITDNAIIPLKERVVDRYYDPFLKLFNSL